MDEYSKSFKIAVIGFCAVNCLLSAASLVFGELLALIPLAVNGLAVYGLLQAKSWTPKYLCLVAAFMILGPLTYYLRIYLGHASLVISLETIHRAIGIFVAIWIFVTSVPIILRQAEQAYNQKHNDGISDDA